VISVNIFQRIKGASVQRAGFGGRLMDRPDQTLSDEAMVKQAQLGDSRAERYLLRRYHPLVRQRIQPYFLRGAEFDDLFQEGQIGLHKAIRDYKEHKAVSFRHFAALCVNRQVITAVRSATRQKHEALAAYCPLEGGGGLKQALSHPFPASEDPNEALIRRDGLEWIKTMLHKHLSGFEWDVLALYLKGKSYREISAMLSKNTKAVDNALARIKEKGRTLQLQLAFS
jgi:RNA polymerase sporulation-specific sigma factor